MSGPSKGVNVLAIFNRGILARGKARKKFSAFGFAFERLTFLSKIENQLKRGEIFV